MVLINEVELVWDVLEELSEKDCVQGFRMELGEGLMSSESFVNIFEKFSRGTIFENIDIHVDEIPVTYRCACGYKRRKSALNASGKKCPRCGSYMDASKGYNYRILDVF